jgi:hypothetical protein
MDSSTTNYDAGDEETDSTAGNAELSSGSTTAVHKSS